MHKGIFFCQTIHIIWPETRKESEYKSRAWRGQIDTGLLQEACRGLPLVIIVNMSTTDELTENSWLQVATANFLSIGSRRGGTKYHRKLFELRLLSIKVSLKLQQLFNVILPQILWDGSLPEAYFFVLDLYDEGLVFLNTIWEIYIFTIYLIIRNSLLR